MWLNNLKIAIIEKNTKLLDELLDNLPELSDPKEIEEAIYLLQEANHLLHTLKDETRRSMEQVKKNLTFLKSTDFAKNKNRLDIKL